MNERRFINSPSELLDEAWIDDDWAMWDIPLNNESWNETTKGIIHNL